MNTITQSREEYNKYRVTHGAAVKPPPPLPPFSGATEAVAAATQEKEKPVKMPAGQEKVVEEIFESETLYSSNLNFFSTNFIDPILKDDGSSPLNGKIDSGFKEMLGTWLYLNNMHQQMQSELEIAKKKYESPDEHAAEISRIFIDYADFFKLYSNYVNNCATLQGTHVKYISSVKGYKDFCNNLITDSGARGQSVASFLIMPVQRIPRYLLLLREVLKNTPQNHPAHDNLNLAFAIIKSVAGYINENKRVAENLEIFSKSQSILKSSKPLKTSANAARNFFRALSSVSINQVKGIVDIKAVKKLAYGSDKYIHDVLGKLVEEDPSSHYEDITNIIVGMIKFNELAMELKIGKTLNLQTLLSDVFRKLDPQQKKVIQDKVEGKFKESAIKSSMKRASSDKLLPGTKYAIRKFEAEMDEVNHNYPKAHFDYLRKGLPQIRSGMKKSHPMGLRHLSKEISKNDKLAHDSDVYKSLLSCMKLCSKAENLSKEFNHLFIDLVKLGDEASEIICTIQGVLEKCTNIESITKELNSEVSLKGHTGIRDNLIVIADDTRGKQNLEQFLDNVIVIEKHTLAAKKRVDRLSKIDSSRELSSSGDLSSPSSVFSAASTTITSPPRTPSSSSDSEPPSPKQEQGPAQKAFLELFAKEYSAAAGIRGSGVFVKDITRILKNHSLSTSEAALAAIEGKAVTVDPKSIYRELFKEGKEALLESFKACLKEIGKDKEAYTKFKGEYGNLLKEMNIQAKDSRAPQQKTEVSPSGLSRQDSGKAKSRKPTVGDKAVQNQQKFKGQTTQDMMRNLAKETAEAAKAKPTTDKTSKPPSTRS